MEVSGKRSFQVREPILYRTRRRCSSTLFRSWFPGQGSGGVTPLSCRDKNGTSVTARYEQPWLHHQLGQGQCIQRSQRPSSNGIANLWRGDWPGSSTYLCGRQHRKWLSRREGTHRFSRARAVTRTRSRLLLELLSRSCREAFQIFMAMPWQLPIPPTGLGKHW